MAAYYSIIEILPEWAPQTEEMGSKRKFWYLPEGENESYWLFKYPPRSGYGEYWAEKIASEVASLLGIACARVQLAQFRGECGSAARAIITGNDQDLIHGNEVLSGALPDYDSTERDFHLADHTLETSGLLWTERLRALAAPRKPKADSPNTWFSMP